MKYNTEQFVRKIDVAIICKFDGEEIYFENGKALADYEFDKRYVVDHISIKNGKAVVVLKVLSIMNINYAGDEMVLGENWIKEHVERYGVEPNLFDGV